MAEFVISKYQLMKSFTFNQVNKTEMHVFMRRTKTLLILYIEIVNYLGLKSNYKKLSVIIMKIMRVKCRMNAAVTVY